MATNEIIIFLNTALEVDAQNAWVTKACFDFIEEIDQDGMIPIVAAITSAYVEDSRNCSSVNQIEHFRYISLASPSDRSNDRSGKFLLYATAFLRILFRVPKKPMWYIFLPGHAGMLACLVCCLLGKRYGLYVRGTWKESGILGVLYRHFFAKAQFIIATGKAFTNRLGKYNDHVQEVAPMMHFGAADLREKSSYEIDEKAVVLFVGQLHPQKGVFELIDAVLQVGNEHAVQLILVGDGSPEVFEELDSVIQKRNCSHLVKVVGRVGCKRELARLFSEADLFAIPTYYPEGFPRVVYEAMCFGLPVVCSNIEGEAGFLRDGENCRYVEKQSASDLAEKISEVLSDEELRKRIGERGLQDVGVLCRKFEDTTHGAQVVLALEASDL